MSEWVQETLCIQITYEILKANKPVADPDFQIRGGGGSSRPWDKGRVGLKKTCFSALRASFWFNNKGARTPRAPPLNPPLQTAGLTSHEKNRKTRKRLVIFKFTFQFSNVESVYSLLSFNGHLYKTDTSVKRTLRVGPCLSLLPLFDSLWDGHLSKMDTYCRSPRCPSQKELTVLCLWSFQEFKFFCGTICEM